MKEIIIGAVIAEAIWETLKMVWQDGKASVDRIGALVVSILLAFGARLDVFSFFDIQVHIPMLGMILTGILLSRGSNFIHDILSSVDRFKK